MGGVIPQIEVAVETDNKLVKVRGVTSGSAPNGVALLMNAVMAAVSGDHRD